MTDAQQLFQSFLIPFELIFAISRRARALEASFNFHDPVSERGGFSVPMFWLAYPRNIHKMVAMLGISQFRRKGRINAKTRRVINHYLWRTASRTLGVKVAR